MDVAKGETKGLIALTPEIDCNTIAMGLQPVTSAVSRNISDTSATPSGIKHKWYVCMYVFMYAYAALQQKLCMVYN
jgi:hypothetical protein